MHKQKFIYYHLANSLIPGMYEVKLYDHNDNFICTTLDNYYSEHRKELYEKIIHYITITPYEIKVYLKEN